MHYFCDSDLSDFELPCPISPKKIDLTTTPDDAGILDLGNSDNAPPALQNVVSQLEKCVERSGNICQLQNQLSLKQIRRKLR